MINNAGKFGKVSFSQFASDFIGGTSLKYNEEHPMPDSIYKGLLEVYDGIKLPKRATIGSAGYDIFAPVDIYLAPGCTATIATGINAAIEEGWALMCFPRSGLGFKFRMQLDNTVGIIDSDYIFSDNEGHILLKITNDSLEDKTLHVDAGKAFAQAVFIPFGITYDDDADGVRNGGFGSTSI